SKFSGNQSVARQSGHGGDGIARTRLAAAFVPSETGNRRKSQTRAGVLGAPGGQACCKSELNGSSRRLRSHTPTSTSSSSKTSTLDLIPETSAPRSRTRLHPRAGG